MIVGAGGHSRTVISTLKSQEYAIHGILDKSQTKDEDVLEVPILGEIPTYVRYVKGYHFFLAIGDNQMRRKYFIDFLEKNVSLPRLVHREAEVHESSNLGIGTLVAAGAMLCPCSKVGDNCIINSRALIEHDTTIGDHVHIAPDVTVAGRVSIGEGCMIGINTTIKDGVKIGRWVKVGAGSVVVDDVPDGAIVAGNPARIISIEPQLADSSHQKETMIGENTNLQAAMEMIDFYTPGYALIVDGKERLVGILTDGLIRRALLSGFTLFDPVSQIMDKDFFYLNEDSANEAIYHFSQKIKFIPILTKDKKIVQISRLDDVYLPSHENYISRCLRNLHLYMKAPKDKDYSYKNLIYELEKIIQEQIHFIASHFDSLLLQVLAQQYSGKKIFISPYLRSQLNIELWNRLNCVEDVSKSDVLILHACEDIDEFQEKSKVFIGGSLELKQMETNDNYTYIIRLDVNDEINAEGASILITKGKKFSSELTAPIHSLQVACLKAALISLPQQRIKRSNARYYLEKQFQKSILKDDFQGGLLLKKEMLTKKEEEWIKENKFVLEQMDSYIRFMQPWPNIQMDLE